MKRVTLALATLLLALVVIPAILAGIIWRANYTRRRRWTSLPDDLQ